MSADLNRLTSWHADWSELRVVVLGLSMTGFSVADTLAELGADVLVVTEDAAEEYARLVPVIGARMWQGPLDTVPEELTAHRPDVVVASPGFPPHHPVVAGHPSTLRPRGCPRRARRPRGTAIAGAP